MSDKWVPRRAEYGPLRQSIDKWQPVADQSVRHKVVGEVTLTEGGDVLGQVTWTRAGERKTVSVDAQVLWQMQQRKGPRVEISARGEW